MDGSGRPLYEPNPAARVAGHDYEIGRLKRRQVPAFRTLHVVVDGGGSEIATGIAGDVFIDFDCTITKWTLLADAAGDVEVDIWKVPYASFPPDVGDSITASDLPTLSGAQSAQDSALTGWTTDISPGDCLRFNIDSIATITRLVISLTLQT